MDLERNLALQNVDNEIGYVSRFHLARERLNAAKLLPAEFVEGAAGDPFPRARRGPSLRPPNDKGLADVEHQAAAHEVVAVAETSRPPWRLRVHQDERSRERASGKHKHFS